MVGLAGHDAHGGLLLAARRGRGDSPGLPLGISSYEASFATFAVRVVLDGPLTGDAARRRAELVSTRRAGGISTRPSMRSRRRHRWISAPPLGATTSGWGDDGAFGRGAALTFRSTLPPGGGSGAAARRRRGGRVPRRGLRFAAPEPGAYRVEVRDPARPDWPVPWIATNPIYLRRSIRTRLLNPSSPPIASSRLDLNRGAVEKDPMSTAKLSSRGRVALAFDYAFDRRAGQPVRRAGRAAAAAASAVRSHHLHRPVAGADARLGSAAVRERRRDAWARSVYLSASPADRRAARPPLRRRPAGRSACLRTRHRRSSSSSISPTPPPGRGAIRNFRPRARHYLADQSLSSASLMLTSSPSSHATRKLVH